MQQAGFGVLGLRTANANANVQNENENEKRETPREDSEKRQRELRGEAPVPGAKRQAPERGAGGELWAGAGVGALQPTAHSRAVPAATGSSIL
jgi:hypothetical protein